ELQPRTMFPPQPLPVEESLNGKPTLVAVKGGQPLCNWCAPVPPGLPPKLAQREGRGLHSDGREEKKDREGATSRQTPERKRKPEPARDRRGVPVGKRTQAAAPGRSRTSRVANG